LDKIRFLALTEKEVLGEGDTAKLEIQVQWIAKPRLFPDCHFFALEMMDFKVSYVCKCRLSWIRRTRFSRFGIGVLV
jgi:hypothetical protein